MVQAAFLAAHQELIHRRGGLVRVRQGRRPGFGLDGQRGQIDRDVLGRYGDDDWGTHSGTSDLETAAFVPEISLYRKNFLFHFDSLINL